MRYLLGALLLAACADPAPDGAGQAWPEANALFHREARFIGADGAYSIDLGHDRILWLFGDTFVARDHVDPHATAMMLRNTIALQTGRDPTRAYIRHYWGRTDDGLASFFPEPAEGVWLWPAHGIRAGDVVVVFFERLVQEGEPGPWSFAGDGWDAQVIENPDDEPSAWTMRPALLPEDTSGEHLGEAVVRDGDHVVVYATAGEGHPVTVSRFAFDDVARGDLTKRERWCGRWAEDCAATHLFELGAPEFSVHFDGQRWLWIATCGFGATAFCWRSAPAPEGPWSDPTTVFRPPESFRDGAFVYAGKAHPELEAGGDLAVTYVPSGFDDFPHALDGIYYFPFFGRIHVE